MQNLELKCLFADHKDKQIDIICVNEKCDKIRLGCADCVMEHHMDHSDDILDFNQFEIWRNESFLITEYVSKVIKEMEQTIMSLQQFVKQCTFDISCNISILTREEINYSIQNLLIYRAMSRQIKPHVEELYSHLQTMKNKVNEVKSMQQNQNWLKKPEERIIYLDWKLQYKKQDIQFNFSKINKHTNIQLSDSEQCAEINSRQWGFCLCEPAVPRKDSVNFSCKIVKLGYGLIHIGICIKEQLNYDPVLYKVGHGNGFTYSHHEKQKNCVEGSFKFTDNDVICVLIDYKKQEISWTKKDSQEKFTINFNVAPNIFPCIGLGDSAKVKITNY